MTFSSSNKQWKNPQCESGQNLSINTSTSFGDTYKTILCEKDHPVQVPAPKWVVFKVTAPAPVIIQPILIPQNVAITDKNIGPGHIITPTLFRADNGKDSNPASLLPTLPTDSKFDSILPKEVQTIAITQTKVRGCLIAQSVRTYFNL